MFDAALPAKAVLIGGLVAAVVMALVTWRAPRSWLRSVSWTWAIGAGVFVASGITDQWPHWPALEDRARFLTVVLPLCLVVETLAAIVRSGRVAWILRWGLAALVTPILLHNTVYLADVSGPKTAEWSTAQATIVLCGLAALLAVVWALLSGLQARTSTRTVLWLLIPDAFATAVAVMLSGYYGAGLLGLGLTGALTGATLASCMASYQSPTRGTLGLSLIGIFTVLLLGRYFGALPDQLAACLLLAPLLAWIFELPRLRGLAQGWRGAGRLACVALPLIVVVIFAQRRFAAEFLSPSRSSVPDTTSDRPER